MFYSILKIKNNSNYDLECYFFRCHNISVYIISNANKLELKYLDDLMYYQQINLDYILITN